MRGIEYGGTAVEKKDLQDAITGEMVYILAISLCLVVAILLITSESWLEPFILLAASGVAVLLNRGTNVMFGAIFIAMSTQLLGDGIFFMSYIVTTCILMGATIDYGILMSSNYVAYRQTNDRATALRLSVEAAMPTVFSSGLILTVCGFVIHFISSQNSISTVGLLIGIGTICSVVMITVVLPSVLYLLDAFVLKLSIRKK